MEEEDRIPFERPIQAIRAVSEELKITTDKDTKFEKAANKKAGTPASEIKATDIEKGTQVTVALRSGSETVAERITLSAKKKKKKAP